MTEPATAKTLRTEKDQNPWELYERRKAELASRELSTGEYQRECRRIADELGI